MAPSRPTACASGSRSSTSRATSASRNFVFGYGSLVEALAAGGSPAELHGHRRSWRVAMDNTRDVVGYKYYVDPDTGERPAVFVSFLDLARDDRSRMRGILFEVEQVALVALDARERNYRRIDMTGAIEPRPDGRVWAYLGTDDARERFALARSDGTAVVAERYYESVRRGLDRIGVRLERPPVPVVPLRRVDL